MQGRAVREGGKDSEAGGDGGDDDGDGDSNGDGYSGTNGDIVVMGDGEEDNSDEMGDGGMGPKFN